MSNRLPPAGAISIAGKTVSRLGLGTMRLTGPGTWGLPADQTSSVHLLREAVHTHGITHIDTADAYGPHSVEYLIRWALYPYPAEVLIATKVGLVRPAPDVWTPLGHPAYLRASVEGSLRRLAVDCLDLCYLHRIDATVPLADQLGTLQALKDEGKIGHIGLSKVTPATIQAAQQQVHVAAVQNVLNMTERYDPAMELCRDLSIPFVPYRPLDAGTLAKNLNVGQALRWLLQLGDHVAPIPGTNSLGHLKELIGAVTTEEV
jgi:pyridoxine 4-dehydrogenase